MQTVADSALVFCALVCTASSTAAQTPVGALAIDERQGDQYGWAVDYEMAGAAQARALSECGGGCRVVLTFNRCAAYAVDQDAGGTAVGWAESFASVAAARQAALSECSSQGGSGCIVRVWGCNGPVIEEELGLDRAARQQIQRGLQAAGFDPDGADGLFGPRTRAAIRGWQTSRGARATGYLDGASVAALRPSALGQPPLRQREPAATDTAAPAGGARPPASGSRASGASALAAGSRVVGASGPGFGAAAAADARPQPGAVFRDCEVCPEMVVMPDGRLALGRYEVTVGEYGAFASATGGGGDDCVFGDSWQNPSFSQTDRHPVTCVSWDDAQAFVSWLSRTAGATYRLPTDAEWERAATSSQRGCDEGRTGNRGTCPVGSYGANGMGLSDMVGNLWEWTEDCAEGDCRRRVLRGGSRGYVAELRRPGARLRIDAGFRVVRPLD